MIGRQSRRAAIVAVLLVLATGVLAACGAASNSSSGSNPGSSTPTTAKSAPEFSGVTLDGTEVSLSEYRGKPVVLAFMASW